MANHFKEWDTLSITSESGSSLSSICKNNIHIPVLKEGSPFNLAPMISTTMYMLVLHAILCDTVKRKKIKFHDFAKNHPAGSIGLKCNEYT
jgi:arabinose-5-phosphate isomerase